MTSSDLNFADRPSAQPYIPTIKVSEIEALTQDQKIRGLNPAMILTEKCMQDWLDVLETVDWRLDESYKKFVVRTAGRPIHPDIIAITLEYLKGRLMLHSNAYPNFFVRWYIWTRMEVYLARFAAHSELLRDITVFAKDDFPRGSCGNGSTESGNSGIVLGAKGTKHFSWMMDVPYFRNHDLDTELGPRNNATTAIPHRPGRREFLEYYGLSDACHRMMKKEVDSTANTATPRFASGVNINSHHGLYYGDFATVAAWTPSPSITLPPIRSLLAGDIQYEYMDIRQTLGTVMRVSGEVLPDYTLRAFKRFEKHMVDLGAIPIPLMHNGDLIEVGLFLLSFLVSTPC